jgi:putative ABC transport system substrate-binding protein
LRRARSSTSGCGASACCCQAARTIREYQARPGAFMQALALLGWTDGRNVRIETRWGAGDADRYCQYAAELVASRRMSLWPRSPRSWRRYSG